VNQLKSVIWDWNGTLLNDMSVSLNAVNRLLSDRNLEILTAGRYLEIFTFPVRDYYEKLGFDFKKESFDVVAHQFVRIYNQEIRRCGLHIDAVAALQFISRHGMKQYILSAMEQDLLEKTIKYNKIASFFEGMFGLDNNFAVSKVDVGLRLMNQYNLLPEETLLIGDTVHDSDVAKAIGCRCILIANGHQSKKRIETTGATVIKNLAELISKNILLT
jgi:phosphoglycolate phosphatase